MRNSFERGLPALRNLIVTIIVTVSMQFPVHAQSVERLDKIAQSMADRGLFNGAVLVARDDKVLLDKGYGLANLTWRVPNSPDVRFLLASLTKQFTAAAVMKLIEEGKIQLDEPIHRYLQNTPASWAGITVRQLLSHTSGIPNHTEAEDFDLTKAKAVTPQALYQRFRNKPLDFSPGTSMHYSNSGYVVLGLLIESVSGMSYEDYLRSAIFTPLGMVDTGVARTEEITSRIATGYLLDGKTLRPAKFNDMSVPFGAGTLYSTTGDLLKWQRALFGGRVIGQKALKEMTTPVRNDYALGLAIGRSGGHTTYFHSGGIDGFSTFMQYDPQTRLTVIALANLQGAASQSLVRKLSAAAQGRKVLLPSEHKSSVLPPEILKRAEGTYQVSPESAAWIVLRGTDLWARIGYFPWSRLDPQSKSSYYVPGLDFEMTAEHGDDGKVSAIRIPELSEDKPWIRVDKPLPTLSAQPIYLRGTMNQWSTKDLLIVGVDGIYRVTIDVPRGRHEIKIASEDWASIDLGRQEQIKPLAEQGTIALANSGDNIAIELIRDARCEFTVDGRDIVEPRLAMNCEISSQ